MSIAEGAERRRPSLDDIAFGVVINWINEIGNIESRLARGTYLRSNGRDLKEVPLTDAKRSRLKKAKEILSGKLDGSSAPGRGASRRFFHAGRGHVYPVEITRLISNAVNRALIMGGG